MRTATTIEASGGDWAQTVEFVREAERLGLDICWVAEAWGSEAPSALGYLAARTSRVLLGSGIIQLGTRTPVALARAAITLSNIYGGRFLLGLGASGPQVIEGLHGVAFGRPVTRMRATVAIVRLAGSGTRSLAPGGGTSIVPEAAAAYFESLAEGLAAAGRSRADLDVCQGAEVAFASDDRALGAMVAARKRELA